MAADPRQRSSRQHATAPEPTVIDWAGPKQLEGVQYGPMPLVLSGAYDSAKTVTLCLKTLIISDLYPGYRWFVGRKVWDELRKTTMSSFFKFCPRRAWEPNGRRSDTEKILELNNGSSYIWGHLDDPDTLTLVRGLEINGFLLDQAEELFEEIFTALMPRLGRWDRVTVPQALVDAHTQATGQPWPWIHHVTGRIMPPSYPLLTCNPDHKLHWIYRRFHPDSAEHHEKTIVIQHDGPECPNVHANTPGNCRCGRPLIDGTRARPGVKVSYHDLGYKMIELSSYDNKYANRQTLQEAEAMDESWKARFLYGKWGITEGQIHTIRPASVLEPDPGVLAYIRNNCALHRFLDHGDSAPTCCAWVGVDREGNVICYLEYYQPNKLISEHRQAITELSDHDHYVLNLADPSMFYLTQQKHGGRFCLADEYSDIKNQPRETAIYWQPADNDEQGTRNRINEYLRPQGYINPDGTESPRPHPITKKMGLWPRVFFVKASPDYLNGCNRIIVETEAQRRVKIGTENGKPIFSDERDPKIVDHAYDVLRYCIASRAPIGRTTPVARSSRSFAAIRAEVKRAKAMDRYRRRDKVPV